MVHTDLVVLQTREGEEEEGEPDLIATKERERGREGGRRLGSPKVLGKLNNFEKV